MSGGFHLFGPDHLAALAAIAIVTLAAIAAVRLSAGACGRQVRWLFAGALAAGHVGEQLVAWRSGWWGREMLPLQLCDVAAMLAVYGLVTLDRRALEPACFFALSGTLPALVTPELDAGFPEFRFIVYFLEHGLTVAAPLLLVGGFGFRTGPGAWRRAFLQVNAAAAVAALANAALGTNFLYLSRKPVGPTPFDWFGPWPVYLLTLEGLVLLVFRLLDLGLGGDRVEHVRHLRMVAGRLAEVGERDLAPGPDDEDAAHLPGIALDRRLARAGAQRAHGATHEARREHAEHPALHAEGAVGLALRVDVDRRLDRELVLEGAREVPVAVADEDEAGAPARDLLPLAVHLHRLLAAEHSAEVAEEHEHDGVLRPEVGERVLPAVQVPDHGACGLLGHLLHRADPSRRSVR